MNTDLRTFLLLPDGSQCELTADAKARGIRPYKFPGDRFPRFEIDGHRYAVQSASELPFVPDFGGPARMLDLVSVDPPSN